MTPWIVQNLWLIPALPMAAAGLSALAPQRCRRFSATLAIGSMIGALLLSLCAFAHTLGDHGGDAQQTFNFNWFQFGDQWLRLGWVLDPLAAVMLVMVAFVGLLIFIYSVGYMAHDENFTRFFTFLSLFAGAMLGVVIANSLLLLFIFWELVGLTSYLLIGFWYHKPSASAAAKKAFITTRVGDVFFFLGMLWLYAETGTLLFYDSGNGCLEQSALAALVAKATGLGLALSTVIGLLIFAGATGKSGQVPLHVWLPDAMEGPTPVSALIHAATMVAAGVFLVARVYPIMAVVPVDAAQAAEAPRVEHVVRVAANETLTPALSLSERERQNHSPVPDKSERAVFSTGQSVEAGSGEEAATITDSEEQTSVLPLPGGKGRGEGERSHKSSPVSMTLQAVTWIGVITAVFAALIAVAQTDIKRILAYSTVSQLGYMMMGLGTGGVAVGIFHLITHAFFKALLFMGAGSVIHGCHGEQDIRRMGGLRKYMPVTFAAYAIGMMALAGVIPFAGFWSKDEILHAAHGWSVSHWPFYLGLFGALLTAFYMTRQVCLVFLGETRARGTTSTSSHLSKDEDAVEHVPLTPHESPRVMTIPLIILAVFAAVLGIVGTPFWPWFQSYLGAEHGPVNWSSVITLMLISTAVVAVGLASGWWFYGRKSPASTDEPDPLERLRPAEFNVLRNKFYVDELYEVSIVRLNAWGARACDWFDRMIWGGAVQLVSLLTLGLSWVNRFADEYGINLGFDQACLRLRNRAKAASRLHNGQVHRYLRVIGVALVGLVLLLTWVWGDK